MKIDYQKMLEQDEEFKQYATEVMFGVFFASEEGSMLLAFMNESYNAGTPVSVLVRMIKNMTTYGAADGQN